MNWDGRTYQGFIHSTRGEWGLYMAPEVRELLGWGTYQRFIRGTIGEWGLYMAPEVRELLR